MPTTPETPVPLHLHMAIVHAKMVRLAQLVDDIDEDKAGLTDRDIDQAVAAWRQAVTDFQAFLLDKREGAEVPTTDKLAELLKARHQVTIQEREADVDDDEVTF